VDNSGRKLTQTNTNGRKWTQEDKSEQKWKQVDISGHTLTLACSITPKYQMRISYPPNLVLILILLGLATKIKFLAVPEVTANLTSYLDEKYKGFAKLINVFRFVFCFLHM
jgi:hypothetical protein